MKTGIIPFLRRKSPTILSVIGAAGTIATAVFAAKETPKALRLLEEEKTEKNRELTTVEKVFAVAPAYWPAAAFGLSTIACIFGANVLSQRQQAALTSAYAMMSQAFAEYRKKANELYGEDADRDIQRAVIKDREDIDPMSAWEHETVSFYIEGVPKLFERTKEEVFRAEYNLNLTFATEGYAAFNDFLSLLNLPSVKYGDDRGWSLAAGEMFYGYSAVEFRHVLRTTDEGFDYLEIVMSYAPTEDFLDM